MSPVKTAVLSEGAGNEERTAMLTTETMTVTYRDVGLSVTASRSRHKAPDKLITGAVVHPKTGRHTGFSLAG